MNANDLLMGLIRSLNNLLTSKQAPNIDLGSVDFAFADDVFFNDVCMVRRRYSSEEVQSTLDKMIRSGPSWVHGNLVRGGPGKNVVVLDFGAGVGNPQPTINVSYEDRDVIESWDQA